ncbi:MAG: hypothetical protein MI741_17025, partial [Rhodospirillales bacterium]|nr:hypothetical protein [Rhodospirillales bacterium]
PDASLPPFDRDKRITSGHQTEPQKRIKNRKKTAPQYTVSCNSKYWVCDPTFLNSTGYALFTDDFIAAP